MNKHELETYEKSLDDAYHLSQSQTQSAIKLESGSCGDRGASIEGGKKIKEYRYGYELYVWHYDTGVTIVYNDCSGARYEFKDRNEAHRFAKGHSQRYKMMY